MARRRILGALFQGEEKPMGFLRQEWGEAKDPFSLDEIQPAAQPAGHTKCESSHLAAHTRQLFDDEDGQHPRGPEAPGWQP